jgi:hypothetical protein
MRHLADHLAGGRVLDRIDTLPDPLAIDVGLGLQQGRIIELHGVLGVWQHFSMLLAGCAAQFKGSCG